MSTRYKNGSHYENHQRAAELHDVAAHAHRVAEQHGEGEHQSGQEHSRQALEHSQRAHEETVAVTVGHGVAAFGHAETAALAYGLWLERGSPKGTEEKDWNDAISVLRSRSYGH